jgi:hypothetical protein
VQESWEFYNFQRNQLDFYCISLASSCSVILASSWSVVLIKISSRCPYDLEKCINALSLQKHRESSSAWRVHHMCVAVFSSPNMGIDHGGSATVQRSLYYTLEQHWLSAQMSLLQRPVRTNCYYVSKRRSKLLLRLWKSKPPTLKSQTFWNLAVE